MTHTPGPWKILYGRNEIYPRGIDAPNDRNIKGAVGCVVRWNGIGLPSSPAGQANARLIAAAPDMLDMLKTIENDDKQVPQWLWQRIQEVIAKAEGRS